MLDLVNALKTAGEPTRLRILAICLQGELTVSELVRILGQSQPRISRHLKLLTEAGLLERFREGNWVFHRLAQDGRGADLIASLTPLLPLDDEHLTRDRQRLAEVKRDRDEAAGAYFERNATEWSDIRSLHVDETEVERTISGLLAEEDISNLIDIGTGTARMLELLGPRIERGQGIDLSREMLSVARSNLNRAALGHCQVRQGDIYQLPFAAASFNAATIHQVLHFIDDQALAITEAARVLKPGGKLLIVDFAPHDHETLRTDHKHRRLGFGEEEVSGWFVLAGLEQTKVTHLPGGPLTVSIWLAEKPLVNGPASTLQHAPAH
jgi:ubiquinone/menaquinone biosynthesis C-methylase UbiE